MSSAELHSNFVVRQLTPDEWRLFRDIRLESLRLEHGRLGCSFASQVHNTEDEWRGWLNVPDKCVMGMFAGAEIIGITAIVPWTKEMIALHAAKDWEKGPANKVGFAKGGYIQSGYRNRKLASMLHRASISWAAKQPDFRRLIAGHRKSNIDAKNLIAALGFVLIETRPYVWADNIEEDAFIYELDLDVLRVIQKSSIAEEKEHRKYA